MFKKLLVAALCGILIFAMVQNSFTQETQEKEESFILEEDIVKELQPTLLTGDLSPQFITSDVLTQRDVEPAIIYYIRNDIYRKFSGLVTNLKLEKIYGILQEDKIATVYFDYSYSSVRNQDKILYEKGKMTFMKFNSGKWFNAELSIYLMDSYPLAIKQEE